MEDVNKQLLDALVGMVGMWKTTCDAMNWEPDHLAEYDIARQAIAAAEQAQQAEPVAWNPGSRPPSVFKTSEAGRQYVADFFANALRRHDFSSYIKGHLAADFACALSDGLHAMHTAQPPAVAAVVPDGWRMRAELRKPGASTKSMLHIIAPNGLGHITYYAKTECHENLLAMLAAAQKGGEA